MATKNKPNELYLTRVYDAPVTAVWEAWADTKQTAQWWGPRGFTTATESKELKPGGKWIYQMTGPDGKVWPNNTLYQEVEKYKKLVYDHGGTPTMPPLFKVTVLFSESGGKTKMDFTMTFATEAMAKETAKFIRAASGNSTWDRLAEYLEERKSGRAVFVINRTFATNVETMFDLWTKPENFQKWLPPTGMEMKFLRADIKPGGGTFYEMHGNGVRMWGTVDYLMLERPHEIVYVQGFADQDGNPSRHPGAPNFPAKMKTTVRFSPEAPAQTRVTVTWEPTGDYSPEDLRTFTEMRAGMTQGWTGSFDKLDALLSQS